ncbi:MAG: hypothetical protein JO187_08100 [Acidobacteria bacterium]|nr:hypothetical protein [Acidobacteriota bacterium]
MLLEFSRLLAGVLILLFHKQIADFMQAQERTVLVVFRQRGVRIPDLTNTAARNIYFCLGLFICGYQMFRIWLTIPGK